MTWHLKDRELERVLEKYSDGNFLKALNFAIERDWIDAANVVTVEFKRKFLSIGYTNDLSFRTDELEEVAEYNPHAWNEYPKVTPPESVLMRVVIVKGENLDVIARQCAMFREDEWIHPEAGYPLTIKSCRFRPWED